MPWHAKEYVDYHSRVYQVLNTANLNLLDSFIIIGYKLYSTSNVAYVISEEHPVKLRHWFIRIACSGGLDLGNIDNLYKSTLITHWRHYLKAFWRSSE